MDNNNNNARGAVLRDPNFRWLIGGGAISGLGDQFTLIALPWLVLKLTNDPLTMGVIVALMGVPRAVFILFGGAIVDSYSPKRVLMLTKYANTVLLGLLAAMVLSGEAHLVWILPIALGIGLAAAFSIPSGTSLMPHVIAPGHLQVANGMMMGVRQVSMLAGPLLAALLFAIGGDGSDGMHEAKGLGLAFAFDCFSFIVSAWTLSRVQTHAVPAAPRENILRSVGAGLKMVWDDTSLRACFIYWGICACIIGGIIQVGLPVLADTRLGGASALGLLLGANGVGALAGMALTGAAGHLRLRNLGTTLLAVDATVGVLLLPLAYTSATWQGIAINVTVGVLTGFMQVAVFTWIQQRVPRAMLGRTMSMFMFIFMGLAPLAAALAGWLLQWMSLTGLFTAAGLFLVIAAGFAYVATPMRGMVDVPLKRA